MRGLAGFCGWHYDIKEMFPPYQQLPTKDQRVYDDDDDVIDRQNVSRWLVSPASNRGFRRNLFLIGRPRAGAIDVVWSAQDRKLGHVNCWVELVNLGDGPCAKRASEKTRSTRIQRLALSCFRRAPLFHQQPFFDVYFTGPDDRNKESSPSFLSDDTAVHLVANTLDSGFFFSLSSTVELEENVNDPFHYHLLSVRLLGRQGTKFTLARPRCCLTILYFPFLFKLTMMTP